MPENDNGAPPETPAAQAPAPEAPTEKPPSSPLSFAPLEAECCGTCNAYLPHPKDKRVGQCIAGPGPQAVVVKFRSVVLPPKGPGLAPESFLVCDGVDGFFPPTNHHLKCRDGYQRKLPFNIGPAAAPAPEKSKS